ncbi:hypothetical protein J437_LFUL016645 [Ladona fulva]|uniref:Uncharacterized protein n=1 Tax=Ladona fulva TaxID=123851 RepID=A0A8K0KNU9_LADFU|nr:hypothetical protein J437_LFUL016645 [Ladona fulva]
MLSSPNGRILQTPMWASSSAPDIFFTTLQVLGEESQQPIVLLCIGGVHGKAFIDIGASRSITGSQLHRILLNLGYGFDEFILNIRQAINYEIRCLTSLLAKAGDQKQQVNPDYQIGNKVQVDLHPISRAQLVFSAKLAPRDGPYVVAKKFPNCQSGESRDACRCIASISLMPFHSHLLRLLPKLQF